MRRMPAIMGWPWHSKTQLSETQHTRHSEVQHTQHSETEQSETRRGGFPRSARQR